MEIRAKIKVLRNFRFTLVLVVVLHAESISGIPFAIRVIPGELKAVEVVKITSSGSSIYLVDKSS